MHNILIMLFFIVLLSLMQCKRADDVNPAATPPIVDTPTTGPSVSFACNEPNPIPRT